jgi:hypothetical protein
MLAGVFLVAAGLILHFKVEIPWLTGWIGKLPGDLVIRKGNVALYFPLATSVLLSLSLSLILSALFKSSK